MGKFIFNYIERYACVRDYWRKHDPDYTWHCPKAWSTRSHIRWSLSLAILTPLLSFIWPWLGLTASLIAFLCYSPLMELWFQYYKEKNKPLWDVMAQMIERGFAFLLCIGWPIVMFLITYYGYSIF